MGSTTLNSSRDQLYTQWQEDVKQARKARQSDIELRTAGDLAQVEAQNAGALERLQREGANALDVAKMQTGAERDLWKMRLASNADEVAARVGSAERIQAMQDRAAMERLQAEEGSGSYKNRMATVAETQAGMRGETQTGYNIDELANFLHGATTDQKTGERIAISAGDETALNEMARQSGYMVKRKRSEDDWFFRNPDKDDITFEPIDPNLKRRRISTK